MPLKFQYGRADLLFIGRDWQDGGQGHEDPGLAQDQRYK